MRWLALLVVLSGCAVAPTAMSRGPQPTCPPNPPVPLGLPHIRTTQMIANYATRLEIAREKSAAARDACEDRLIELWAGQR